MGVLPVSLQLLCFHPAARLSAGRRRKQRRQRHGLSMHAGAVKQADKGLQRAPNCMFDDALMPFSSSLHRGAVERCSDIGPVTAIGARAARVPMAGEPAVAAVTKPAIRPRRAARRGRILPAKAAVSVPVPVPMHMVAAVQLPVQLLALLWVG